MRESLFSPSWYRVSGLRPRIRSHIEIHRHTYRKQLWYVLEDRASGKFQRFTPAANLIIGLMDGERTVEEIWQMARSRLEEDAPTQEEMIHLLSQLHAVDVLQSDVPPDTLELLKRFEKRQNAKWRQNIRSPLAMRFALFDPEAFLRKAAPFARPFFGWFGAALWLVVLAIGVVLAGMHWQELTQDMTDRILAPGNLVLLWVIYPVLKAFHEFGHAFAIKVFGGEVHEMGIMFLVLTPVPYVDASSSLAFRSKWQRMIVGGMGIAAELFIASVALMVWVNVEVGPLRALLYNVIIVAGVSSVLFNGNPLLRYDGYYILADLLEIPNLGPRGNQYLGYLAQRYLFGVPEAQPPLSAPGERAWFVTYTVTAFVYRIFIYVAIIGFIAGKFLTIGLLLALWAIVTMLGLPLFKAGKFLFSSPRLGRKRKRAVGVSAGILGLALAIIVFLPLPLTTVTQGVLWFPEESIVRARTDGFVDKLVYDSGSTVKRGDLLLQCSDPLLPARIAVSEAQLRELQTEYDMNERTNRVQAQVTLDEIEQVKQQLDYARTKEGELAIASRTEGVFFVPAPRDLPGRYVKRGEIIGYVLKNTAMNVRVVAGQTDADLIRNRTKGVDIRLPEKLWATLKARLVREVPAGTENLPAPVLGQVGGGDIVIDPRDQKGLRAYQKIFLFDIQLPHQAYLFHVGGRVYVKFNHGYEPLAFRWYRAIRAVFLKRFNV